MWDTEKLVQPLFSKYSHIDILRHVTSRFVGRAFDWWQERQYNVKKGRISCINTFYELKTCMWKHFIPCSFRITKAQQARIEDFIDIGDAFIENIAKFSRLEKDFKHNLDLLLSEQRKRQKYKREQAKQLQEFEKKRETEEFEMFCVQREQEEKEINEKKKREEEEKAKEESLRKAKEENDRKELEEREKIKQESNLEIQSQVVELK